MRVRVRAPSAASRLAVSLLVTPISDLAVSGEQYEIVSSLVASPVYRSILRSRANSISNASGSRSTTTIFSPMSRK